MLIPQTITKDLDTAPVKIVNDNNEVFHQKNKENLLDTSTSLNKVTFIQTQSEAEKMNNSQSRSTSSFPKLFSDDWSIFTPNTPETTVVGNAIPEPRLEAETVTIQEERDDHSQCTLSSLCLSSSVSQISQSPLSFPRSMSIESIYLIWTSSTRSIEENERPNKKLRKMNNSDENIAINDSISTEKSENNENKKIEENIYKEVHSKILI
ncbi:uncharacterized protein BX663DRAFT_513333, partial [Cokeromyces recurvatus]|uniref:uncharacterized protein n=1 Tax=Cokeromyces recurvatus TaxID=90255 RepID=UPI0022209C45